MHNCKIFTRKIQKPYLYQLLIIFIFQRKIKKTKIAQKQLQRAIRKLWAIKIFHIRDEDVRYAIRSWNTLRAAIISIIISDRWFVRVGSIHLRRKCGQLYGVWKCKNHVAAVSLGVLVLATRLGWLLLPRFESSGGNA